MRTRKRGGAAKNKGPVSEPREGRCGCRGVGGRAASHGERRHLSAGERRLDFIFSPMRNLQIIFLFVRQYAFYFRRVFRHKVEG